MANWVESAFAEHEARYRAHVLHDTWGHLDPIPDKEYTGYVVYAYTAWGQAEVVEADFANLQGGPGFYEHINEWAYQQTASGQQRVGVWRWDGTYRVGKRGRAYFKGKKRQLWVRPD